MRWVSTNVSLAILIHTSVNSRQLVIGVPCASFISTEEALDSLVPCAMHQDLIRSEILRPLAAQLLRLEDLAVERPQRRITRTFDQMLDGRIERAEAGLAHWLGSKSVFSDSAVTPAWGIAFWAKLAHCSTDDCQSRRSEYLLLLVRPRLEHGAGLLHPVFGLVAHGVIDIRASLSSKLEHDDLANRLAFVQQVEAAIDLVEPERSAHQSIHRQSTLAIQVDVPRYVARGHTRADIAALERSFFRHQIDGGQSERRRGRRQTGGDRSAAAARNSIGQFQRAHRASELEREFDAA